MSLAWKVAVTAVLFALCAVAAVVLIVNLLGTPPTVDFSSEGSGQSINVNLQTVGAFGSGNHPDWVSYLVRSPQGQWVHTTVFQVPEHVRVNVTIVQYDSGSPLRNQQLGQVTGTAGNVATLNGKPFRVLNSNAGNGVAHTFSIPSLGINVPLLANNGNANLCGAAPCTPSSPHKVIRFSFTTPGPGNYRWQCFVPCGAGWLFGNGGPMSTLGYMGGFMKVVA
jgi:heme/copper-type cytochrome/quinol oxidase subunit 2